METKYKINDVIVHKPRPNDYIILRIVRINFFLSLNNLNDVKVEYKCFDVNTNEVYYVYDDDNLTLLERYDNGN